MHIAGIANTEGLDSLNPILSEEERRNLKIANTLADQTLDRDGTNGILSAMSLRARAHQEKHAILFKAVIDADDYEMLVDARDNDPIYALKMLNTIASHIEVESGKAALWAKLIPLGELLDS